MVTEQTRSVVESKFGTTHLVALSLVVSSPVLCSGLLLTLMDSLNNLSLRCADSDGWHRQKHQQLFQSIPRAELLVQLHHLYQPCSRQDWGPLPWNWQNGLLQVKPPPKSWENVQWHFWLYTFLFLRQVYINITSTFIYVKGILISVLSLKDTQCLIFSPSPAGFLSNGLDCLLTGGLAVLLCAAWWFWYWHSTTWACCAAPWATTSTPHRQHEAASPTRGEQC